jgi:hypothetical protein
MWRRKKLTIVVLLTVVVLVGSIGGVVLAQTENGDERQPGARNGALLDKVYEIYNAANPENPIDREALEAAFAQAKGEMRDEARQSYLQRLVEGGRITQLEADQYEEWWQARPDTQLSRRLGRLGGHGFGGRRGHRFGGEPCPEPADTNS